LRGYQYHVVVTQSSSHSEELLLCLWLRWQHPTAKGTSVGVLFKALATGLQVLMQRKQEERYARYVLALQASSSSAAEIEP
jgi:hypothetical protein